jgi:hypothetical protein
MTLAVPRVRLILPVSDARCQARHWPARWRPQLTPAVMGVG